MARLLAKNVCVRKESWGLLFYSPARHNVCFVRSGDWLYPRDFDANGTVDGLIGDIAGRTGKPEDAVERFLQKTLGHLLDNGMIVNHPINS